MLYSLESVNKEWHLGEVYFMVFSFFSVNIIVNETAFILIACYFTFNPLARM